MKTAFAARDTTRAALVIVAHPDDEIIWCGGLILQNRAWRWTILSLCRGQDPDRSPRFERVCKHLGALGIMSDLDDGSPLAPITPSDDIGERIDQHVRGRRWDLCVTHGARGEYGHLRHAQIHHEVLRLAAGDQLRCGEIWTFAYDHDTENGTCLARPGADICLTLTEDQLAEKKRIVNELYGFSRDSFEVTACVSPEAFDRHKAHDIGGIQ